MASSEWMAAEDCTRIATEATAIYGSAVWHVLSNSAFALSLANAAHIKNVRGRKTDERRHLARRPDGPRAYPGELRAGCSDQELCTLLRTSKAIRARAKQSRPAARKTLEDVNIRFTRSSPMSFV
jgi:transposase